MENRKSKTISINEAYFRKHRKYRINRAFYKGVLLFLSTTMIGGGVYLKRQQIQAENERKEQIEMSLREQRIRDAMPIGADVDDLNHLKLVFDNSGMDEDLYEGVLLDLKQQQITFREYQEFFPVQEDETLISLTTHPSVKGEVALYGPKEHANSNADNLMISFVTACEHKDVIKEEPHFGRKINDRLEKTSLEERVGVPRTMITLQFSDSVTSDSYISSLLVDGLVRYSNQKAYAPNEQYYHTVTALDNLSSLAEQYHISQDSLKDINEISNINMLRSGTSLQIKSRDTEPLKVNKETKLIGKQDMSGYNM